MRRAFSAAAMIVLVSCASVRLVEVQEVETLYFGRARPGGTVSDAEWRQFVAEEVTKRFPGFTEWTAEGHWRATREATSILQIIHPPRAEHDRAIEEIIRAYKAKFQQEAVLRVRHRALALLE